MPSWRLHLANVERGQRNPLTGSSRTRPDTESPALLLGSPRLTPNHPLLPAYSILVNYSATKGKKLPITIWIFKKLSADYKTIENIELKRISLVTGWNLNFKCQQFSSITAIISLSHMFIFKYIKYMCI